MCEYFYLLIHNSLIYAFLFAHSLIHNSLINTLQIYTKSHSEKTEISGLIKIQGNFE
jgi:hypothetical protein